MAPTGDFAQLDTAGTVHGQMDTFIAKYDSNSKLIWMSNFSGSANDQVKQIKATDDGGIAVLIETNSNDGDMENQNGDFADVDWYGDIFDCFAAKISATGELLWTKAYGG